MLKSLELNGFKSFAQKTVLEFPKGITAIVGPNGSGKSNVIDAIRWIMGEREAKNLRGGKSEDLIFAGTPQRPRVGVARVGISFDNSSKFFPVEFDEITVTREVNREGNSTYHINKSEVRAKDVVDFFARSRLGTRGIAIINQGSSDLFVRANSQDRRIMVEEVLGLKEYQLKKHDAERKLKLTSSNLEKIKLMIEEVAPRLRMLKKQVSKYESLDLKKSELIKLENAYFGVKAKNLRDSLSENDSAIFQLNKEISEKNKEFQISAENLKKIENENSSQKIQKDDKDASDELELLAKRSQIQREIGKLEARMEFLSAYSGEDILKKEEMIFLLKETKEKLEKFLNDPTEIIMISKSIIGKIKEFFEKPLAENSKELERLEGQKNNLLKELAVIEEHLEKIKLKEHELTKGLAEFNEKFKRAFELKESKKEEIRTLESRKNHFVYENEKLRFKLDELRHDWVRNERNEKDFDTLSPSSEFAENKINLDDLEKQIYRLRAEIISIGEIDEMLITEAREVETHHKYLAEQLSDLEKASDDLDSLIEKLKTEIDFRFKNAFKKINDEFNHFFRLMFDGGSAKMRLKTPEPKIEEIPEGGNIENQEEEPEKLPGIEIELTLPKKKIHSLDILSGGEKSLVSIAALFALISVSPPPFLVLDEIDAPLDEKNSKRFAELIKDFETKVQFILVTHNRTIMEAADVLYGIAMNNDGTSKLLSLKFEENMAAARG